MQVSVTTWSTLSKLLDEALDLEPAARDTWLERLSVTQPQLVPAVRKLLAAHASSETADVLAQLPSLNRSESGACVSSLAPGDRIGPYRLKREIGTGGMADVWLAERADGALTREVALKLPLINRLRRDLAQRFARERDILARLEHPHIARLYDAGVTDDGLPYLAMEYVDGQPITEYCDGKRLDVAARLKLFLQVLEAVQYAHASLIIHRDLKPSNILATANGEVRLLDFGIAKLLAGDDAVQETQLTQLSGRALTPDYASPEQIKGEPLTIATDVYSLGVVLYELLAGQRPYRLKVKSTAQLEQAILDAEPVRPSSAVTAAASEARGADPLRLPRALEGDLDTITLKALAKLPADRYATIAAFADDLQRERDGRPVLARPASLSYRAKKFVARNKLAVGAASSIATILVAATVISLWQTRVAQEQTSVAQREAKRAQAVQRFLLDVFTANSDAQEDPVRARETTARELLETGAARVSQQLSDVPEVQDEVLATLSDMYRSLGLSNRETEIESQRLAIRRKMFGANDPRVAEVLINLAYTVRTTADTQKAPALLAEAKEIIDKNPRTPALTRARLLIELARADMYTNVTRMRAYANEASRLLESDVSSRYLALALRFEASANSFLGYWKNAATLNERALAELKKNDLRPFNQVLTVTVHLADDHALRGDVHAAERVFREILAESKRRNGELHVDTLHVEARLVNLLHTTSRRDEARRLRESILEKLRQRSASNADVGMYGTVQRNAASTLFGDGQFGAAAPLMIENTLQARRFFPNSTVLAVRLLAQGQLMTEIGRYAEADALLDEAASVHAAALGPDARTMTASRFSFAQARLLIASGRHHAAVDALVPLASAPVPEDVVLPIDRIRAQIALALAHLQLGQAAQAIDVGRSVLDQLEESPVRSYYQTLEADAALLLGRAQLQIRDVKTACPNIERSLSLRTANDHPGSPWIAEAQIALADCLLTLGDRTQARSLIQRAASIHAQHAELGEHYKQPLRAVRQRAHASALALPIATRE